MPNGKAQEALIRRVYEEARIDPSLTGFVEAHGTGTKVGDPLEATALNAVFGKGRTPRQPLLVGSVKSNIGHTEGTSGVVSVIKTTLALERGFVPPNCNFEKANDEIPMEDWNMKVKLTTDLRYQRTELNTQLGPQEADAMAPWQTIRECEQLRLWRDQRPCYSTAWSPTRRRSCSEQRPSQAKVVRCVCIR